MQNETVAAILEKLGVWLYESRARTLFTSVITSLAAG